MAFIKKNSYVETKDVFIYGIKTDMYSMAKDGKMSDFYGFLLSFIIIGSSIIISEIFTKIKGEKTEISRKIIHILVGNWILITPFFTNYWTLISVPLIFVVVNYLSTKYKLIKVMERDDSSFGTVYYAISLFILCTMAYFFEWKILAFSGILIMAYADGLAAVLGNQYGKWKPFAFAKEKSFVGSFTVFVVTFLISILCLTIFKDFFEIPNISFVNTLVLSLATAMITTFVELIGTDGYDNITVPLFSGMFLSIELYLGLWELNIYLVLASIILFFAVRKKSLTLSGSVVAFVVALNLYAFGGFWVGISLIAFFLLGSIISKIKNNAKEKAEARQEITGQRSWKQVLANSLPACVLVWLYYIFPEKDYFVLLAISVFAAASADTFSSELGMLSKGKVYDVIGFKEIPAGLSGGVSLAGLLFGIIGSMCIAVFAVSLFGIKGFCIATLLGICGTIIDSILGSLFQRKYKDNEKGLVEYVAGNKKERGFSFISNNTVNLLTLCIVSFIGYLILNW